MTDTSWIDPLNDALADSGLFIRGGFHPGRDDEVPLTYDRRTARTVVLIGNAGGALWQAFQDSRPDLQARHPLDTWAGTYMRAAAAATGATLVDPMRPPYPPIQQWAVRAGAGFRSPINLLVHHEYGLWHTFRGALLYSDVRPLPEIKRAESPCDTCARKPCLTTCPASAFAMPEDAQTASFDAIACVSHVDSTAGKACQTVGCLARRACPVGRSFAYAKEPAAYHMAAVVRTVRRWQAAGQDIPPRPDRGTAANPAGDPKVGHP